MMFYSCKMNICIKMRILNCVLLIFLMFFCQNCSASRITVHATPSTIYPILTKTLQIRCAVESNTTTTHRRYIRQAVTSTSRMTSVIINAVNVTAPTRAPMTIANTIGIPVATVPIATAQPTTQAEISHIISIIVSKHDKVTGKLQEVASLSSFDPPTASIDFDKITVDGHSNSSPVEGEQGYLQITWEYPTSAQSGSYTCEVFALDSTLHPLSISQSVQITSLEPTVPELASIVAQNDKYITALRQNVSDLTNQISALKLQSLEQKQEMSNGSATIQQRIEDIRAQNIQTGSVTCNNDYVAFQRPFNNTPTLVFAVNGLKYRYQNTVSYDSFTVTPSNLNETGFTPVCSVAGFIGSTFVWVAIDN